MLKFGVCLLFIFSLANGATYERRERDNARPMVVDIPAGLFSAPSSDEVPVIEPQSQKETEINLEESVPASTLVEIEKQADENIKKPQGQVDENENENPSIFGIRMPTIMIYRRPIFQSPFISLSQRPLAASSDGDSAEDIGSQYRPSNLFSHMDTMMKRMQEQMSSFWGSLMTPAFNNRPLNIRPLNIRPIFSVDSEEEAGGSNEKDSSFLDMDKLPANYTNSTSETKMIDGQLVTVNKTVHKVSGNNSNGFFHFSVVKIQSNKPKDSATATTVGVNLPEKEKEEVETSSTVKTSTSDPAMNEIDGFEKVEGSNNDEKKYEYFETNAQPTPPKLGAVDDFVEFVPIEEEKEHKIQAKDLRSDIRVNKLLEKRNLKSGGLSMVFNPDAELI